MKKCAIHSRFHFPGDPREGETASEDADRDSRGRDEEGHGRGVKQTDDVSFCTEFPIPSCREVFWIISPRLFLGSSPALLG